MGNKKSQVVHFSDKASPFENSLSNGQSPSSHQLSVAVEEAMSIYLQELNDRLKEVLSDFDNHLFDKSSKSNDGEHFVAMRTLRLEKESLIKRFKEETIHNFKEALGKCSSASTEEKTNEDDLSLSLVEERDLEERIAIDTMTGKARKENKVALNNLRQRLDVLMPNKVITEELNPFEPSFVCSAFFDVIQPIDLTLEFKLVLYKYLERQVVDDLCRVYKKVNDFFVERGILPQLKEVIIEKEHSNHSSSSRHQARSNLAQSSNQASESSIAESAQQQANNYAGGQEIIGMLGQLLAERRSPNQVRVEQQVDTGQLLNALSNIQFEQPTAEGNANLADIRSQISTQLPENIAGQVNQGALGQFSDDMIDVVTMLFDFILDDENLHAEIRAIIARLQIPILKVGLVDKSFLSDRKHSARILLNELAHAGLSWDPKDASSKPMLEKIQSVSESIFNDFKDDVSIFQVLLDDFVAFKEQHGKRARIFEKRTKEAEEGKAKAETARSKVNDILKSICYKKHVPLIAQQLLKSVWVHVMFLESLKNDDKSWDAVTQIAKMLIWSVQPVKEQERLDKLVKTVPVLVKNLKLGFNKIAYSQIEASGLLDRLEDAHREIIVDAKEAIKEAKKDQIVRLKPASLFAQEDMSDKDETSQEEQAEDNNEVILEEVIIEEIAFSAEETGQPVKKAPIDIEVLDESYQAINNLHAGSWVELKVDDKFVRCKLAAKILSSDKFIFVNRSGVKVAEYLSNELAAAYQLENIKLLNDDALFDRALESVISSLRSLKSDD